MKKQPKAAPGPVAQPKKSTRRTSARTNSIGESGSFRARVRMYRHGLGDCFLLTFKKRDGSPFHALIDCGALNRKKEEMTTLAEAIKETLGPDPRLDLVIATHEHKDHLSGFNQAREVFNGINFGAVWLGWTENLTEAEASAIKEAKKSVLKKLNHAMASPFANSAVLENVRSVLGFEDDQSTAGTGTIAEALQYLKERGGENLRYLSPGEGPISLPDVDDVRVYVLGPPKDPYLLKSSEVTAKMKRESVIYHLMGLGFEGLAALDAAVSASLGDEMTPTERYHPFGAQHRIGRQSDCFRHIKEFVRETYDDPEQAWRTIDEDWLGVFGELALHLDNDTNNTSLVLAFEFASTGEVLLFVGDAQVGNWQSWAGVVFEKPDSESKLPAHDLLRRTIFYKVGHHCSHNATIKTGGLELMESKDLVAFVPLDKATAKAQGKKGPNGKPKGWDMPAKPLFDRLVQKTNGRVVLSDRSVKIPQAALDVGITTDPKKTYIEYTLPHA